MFIPIMNFTWNLGPEFPWKFGGFFQPQANERTVPRSLPRREAVVELPDSVRGIGGLALWIPSRKQ